MKFPTPGGGGGANASMVNSASCLSARACAAVGAAGPVRSPLRFSGFWNGKSWRLAATA